MKYVMFEIKEERPGFKLEVPIIFPNQLIHREVASAIKPMLLSQFPNAEIKIVAAGDCTIMSPVTTHGKSETLKIAARAEDGDTIAVIDYLGVML
jgi:hypothetical protein